MSNVRVIVTPHRDTIRFRIIGKVYCRRQRRELPKAMTLPKTDLRWIQVFGSATNVQNFCRAGHQKTMIVSLSALGYDPCDHSL